jgi:hypothetical protein
MSSDSREGACITDFSFDRWSARELQQSEEDAVVGHLSQCARCQQRQAELAAACAAFLANAPYRAPSAASRSRHARAWIGGAALALAAVVLLVARPSGRVQHSTRSKGSERLGFYVKRGESVRRGASGQQVRAGDQVRFVYTAHHPSYLAILSYDSAGHMNVYHPQGPRAELAPAGTDVALPSSVILDDTTGRELITGLFCDREVELAPLTKQLLERQGEVSPPDGCRSVRLVLHKEAR